MFGHRLDTLHSIFCARLIRAIIPMRDNSWCLLSAQPLVSIVALRRATSGLKKEIFSGSWSDRIIAIFGGARGHGPSPRHARRFPKLSALCRVHLYPGVDIFMPLQKNQPASPLRSLQCRQGVTELLQP